MSDKLKHKMIHALAWTSIDRFGQQIVQFIIGIVLARLLSPSDYGLIGMLMIFIALSSSMIDGGFGQALIRKKEANKLDFSTIFFLNLALSIALYIVLFFAAPRIACFFNQPQLINISRVLFLSILFYAAYFIQYVLIVKELAYKSLAKINISSTIISGGLGIYLAINGFGVWSLVYQQISYHFFRLVLFYFIRKWKPSLMFSVAVIKEHWNFSIHLLGTSLLNVFFNNIYIVLIGKFYPLKQVGYYTQANKLSETINYSFQQILQGASFPLLVQIQDDDERYRRVYRKMNEIISLFIFPLIFTLIIIAEPLIITLLSEKWKASVVFFQILCLANIFNPFFGLNTSVLNSRGASKKQLQLELFKKGLIFVSILFCFSFGIEVMLIGFVIANFMAFGISMIFIKKNLHYYYKHQLKDIAPSFVIAGIVSSILLFIKITLLESNLIQLSALIPIAAIVYIILLFVLKKEIFDVGILKLKKSSISKMKISVIITTYNSEQFISRTIQSILNQEKKDIDFELEIIVVDDCSTDNTKSIVKQYDNIVFIENKKNSGGPNKGRNIALQKCTGDYICIVDHDDEWLPLKMSKQLKLANNSI